MTWIWKTKPLIQKLPKNRLEPKPSNNRTWVLSPKRRPDPALTIPATTSSTKEVKWAPKRQWINRFCRRISGSTSATYKHTVLTIAPSGSKSFWPLATTRLTTLSKTVRQKPISRPSTGNYSNSWPKLTSETIILPTRCSLNSQEAL